MEGIEHRTVSVNGLNMHVAEMGQGPVVLFLHGFPELWYTWRRQIAYVAARGYRAIAPDLRAAAYTSLHAAGDMVLLLDAVAPDQAQVFVVGHDWGAMVAWALCLFRPDKVRALVNMSVVFNKRNPKKKPLEALRAAYGDDYYICRIQVLSLTIYIYIYMDDYHNENMIIRKVLL